MPKPSFFSAALTLRRALMAAGLLLPLGTLASPAGDALRQLQGDDWVTRNTTLADLGISDAGGPEQQRRAP